MNLFNLLSILKGINVDFLKGYDFGKFLFPAASVKSLPGEGPFFFPLKYVTGKCTSVLPPVVISFLAALGPRWFVWAFSSCGEQGLLFAAVHELLAAVESLVMERELQGAWASVVTALRLSCSVARGILPDQGLNLCPLHWEADYYPLHHQGSSSSKKFLLLPTSCSLSPITYDLPFTLAFHISSC